VLVRRQVPARAADQLAVAADAEDQGHQVVRRRVDDLDRDLAGGSLAEIVEADRIRADVAAARGILEHAVDVGGAQAQRGHHHDRESESEHLHLRDSHLVPLLDSGDYATRARRTHHPGMSRPARVAFPNAT
jgi:hypothetical protein